MGVATIAKIWIHPFRVPTGYRYRVTLDAPDGEEILSSSKVPSCDAARLLDSRGINGTIEVYRVGRDTPDYFGEIDHLRGKTISETDRAGPYFTKWRPFETA